MKNTAINAVYRYLRQYVGDYTRNSVKVKKEINYKQYKKDKPYSNVTVITDNGKVLKESDNVLKDLNNVIDYNRGFKDFDSLEKYLNSKGYEVADNGDDYIDIASPDGYRYSFDLDYSSEAPGGRISIGKFIDKDSE